MNPYQSPKADDDEQARRLRRKSRHELVSFQLLSAMNGATVSALLWTTILVVYVSIELTQEMTISFVSFILAAAIFGAMTGVVAGFLTSIIQIIFLYKLKSLRPRHIWVGSVGMFSLVGLVCMLMISQMAVPMGQTSWQLRFGAAMVGVGGGAIAGASHAWLMLKRGVDLTQS